VDECERLPRTRWRHAPTVAQARHQRWGPVRRGIHSSTFRLNVSAFCGMRVCIVGLLMGCLVGVRGYQGRVIRMFLCQKRLRLN